MRRAARVDTTQGPIVAALRGVGARVWIVHRELDLVVFFRGRLYLMDPKARRKAHRTPSQIAMLEEGWPISFPSSVEEALKEIGAAE